jgi:dTDP-4-amino-4,6-dideoxygalactose transaminase
MLNTPFSPWPSFSSEEANAIAATLLSNRVNYWTGQECRKFEKEFAVWAHSSHAIALSNGTMALDLALHGLGIGARNGGSLSDEVIVTPRTFIASISCVVTAGATPVFADVERDSGNISAATIAKVIGKNTKAVIPVHIGGWPCDLDPIMALAAQHDFKVIEDCAQAHGALYKGRSVGSIGHVGAWSFCQDKIMTTGGEGGMVTCRDENLWARMWAHKDHGKSFDAVYHRQHPPGFRWLHESFGTNWRMLEMQAVLGRLQLKQMPSWTAKRNENAAAWSKALLPFSGDEGAVRIPAVRCAGCTSCGHTNGCRHAYYKYYVYVRPENLAAGWSRDRIIAELLALGFPAYQGSCSEVYLESAFNNTPWRPENRLPVAKELGETSLMFLVHPTLTETDLETGMSAIQKVFSSAQG